MAIVGLAKVVREGYPDHTAFDPEEKYFDPKSDPDKPRWMMVDIQGTTPFPEPLTRDQLKTLPGLEDMGLLRRGMRLSVMPVAAEEWQVILKAAGVEEAS